MAYSDMEQMQRIIYLLSGYIKGNLNFQETRELENWIAAKPANRALFEQLQDKDYRDQVLAQWQPQTAEDSLQRVKQKIANQKKPARWPRWVSGRFPAAGTCNSRLLYISTKTTTAGHSQ